jgi:hypothetical protein
MSLSHCGAENSSKVQSTTDRREGIGDGDNQPLLLRCRPARGAGSGRLGTPVMACAAAYSNSGPA